MSFFSRLAASIAPNVRRPAAASQGQRLRRRPSHDQVRKELQEANLRSGRSPVRFPAARSRDRSDR